MALTDTEVRAAKPRDGKLAKLSDGHGLQLWAHPSGRRSWHLAYRADGKQRMATLGAYPEVSLKDARLRAAEIRMRLAKAPDPSETPSKPTATFGAVKAEWLDRFERSAAADATKEKTIWLVSLAAPLDAHPIAEIRAPDILTVLRPIEAAGHLETAGRLRSTISRIFRYAAAHGLVDADPTTLLRGAIAAPKPVGRSAIVDRPGVARLMRAIDGYGGRGGVVRAGLMLLAMTAARPGELRLAEWEEFDLDAGIWYVPKERMKMRLPHRAPLARQAVEILRTLKAEDGLAQPPSPFVLPSPRHGRALSENTFNAALRILGFAEEEMSAHGFRSSFSTLANESGLWAYDAIERALAHQDASDVRRAYHRADYFEERRRLMQWWADEITAMTAGD